MGFLAYYFTALSCLHNDIPAHNYRLYVSHMYIHWENLICVSSVHI